MCCILELEFGRGWIGWPSPGQLAKQSFSADLLLRGLLPNPAACTSDSRQATSLCVAHYVLLWHAVSCSYPGLARMGRVPLILHHLHHVAIVQVETIDAHLTAHSLPSHGDTTSHRPLSEASGIAALDGLSHPLRQLSQDFNATSMSPEEAMGPSDAPDSTTIVFLPLPKALSRVGPSLTRTGELGKRSRSPIACCPCCSSPGSRFSVPSS